MTSEAQTDAKGDNTAKARVHAAATKVLGGSTETQNIHENKHCPVSR